LKGDTTNYLSDARNRDPIPEHKNSIQAQKMVNGPGNSQAVYAFAQGKNKKEALQAAREAALGKLSPQGQLYKFLIAGGNHTYQASADGSAELEREGSLDEAKELRRIPCYILAWPEGDEKTPEGRQAIVTAIREVGIL
jgi:hypothetical protein